MAVMEARMTRTKRDVSVGIHSSSHGHEIMSDFTSPGPFRHKTARVTAVVSHGSGAEDRLTPIPLILPFGELLELDRSKYNCNTGFGTSYWGFCDPIQVSLNRCVGGSIYISGCKRERNNLVAT